MKKLESFTAGTTKKISSSTTNLLHKIFKSTEFSFRTLFLIIYEILHFVQNDLYTLEFVGEVQNAKRIVQNVGTALQL